MIRIEAEIKLNLITLFKKMQKNVEQAIEITSIEMQQKAIDNYTANGSNMSGSAARIDVKRYYKKKNPSANVRANFKHAAFVEFGTRSKTNVPDEWKEYASSFRGSNGKVSYKAFIKWVERKGIAGLFNIKTRNIKTRRGSFSRSKKSMQLVRTAAYLIAHSVNEHGSTPHPFMYPAFFEVRPKFLKRIQDLCNKI